MAETKTKATAASVPAFINALPDDAQRADAKALVKIMHEATGEEPTMWGPSIIGFGSHHYVYESGREGDMPLVSFAPRKAAIVLYLSKFSGYEQALAKIGKHTTGKGCVYIKKIADVDAKALERLIKDAATAARAKND